MSLLVPACGGDASAPVGRTASDSEGCETTPLESPPENARPEESELWELTSEKLVLANGRAATLAEHSSNAENAERRGAEAGVSLIYALDVPLDYPGPGDVSIVGWEFASGNAARLYMDDLVENLSEDAEVTDTGENGEAAFAVLVDDSDQRFVSSTYVWRDGARAFILYGIDQPDSTNVLSFWRCLDY